MSDKLESQQPAAEVNAPSNPRVRESGRGLKKDLQPLLEKGVSLGVFDGYFFRNRSVFVKRKVDIRGGYEQKTFRYTVSPLTYKILEEWVRLAEAAHS